MSLSESSQMKRSCIAQMFYVWHCFVPKICLQTGNSDLYRAAPFFRLRSCTDRWPIYNENVSLVKREVWVMFHGVTRMLVPTIEN